jgi:hypothetical protein
LAANDINQPPPAADAPHEEWVHWLVGVLAARWPQARVRAALPGMQPPGVRRGVVPDVEFWYPNDAGVYTLHYLYTIMPTARIGTREGLDELTALLGYCRTNGRLLTLIVPDRPLQQDELEALDGVLLATLNPMLFDVAAYQIDEPSQA